MQSIWKADHYPDAEIGNNCRGTTSNGDTRMCFLQAALLTVLPKVPENAGSTVLRPAYFRSTKTLYSIQDLDLNFFSELPSPVRPAGDIVSPDWDRALGNLEFPETDWGGNWPAVEVHHSKYRNYGDPTR